MAKAPIEELLAGSDGIVYTIDVKGDGREAERRVSGQPWVSDVQVTRENDCAHWLVRVTDDAVAESQLLRLMLADEHLVVTAFGRRTYELEDVFMNLVEENGSGER